jgi:ABC-type multidrug transport system fused ATPase/permease subunit
MDLAMKDYELLPSSDSPNPSSHEPNGGGLSGFPHKLLSSTSSTHLSFLLTEEGKLNTPLLFGGLIGVFALGGLANAGRVVLFKCAGERIIASLRNRLFSKVIRQDIGFHDKNQSGELISRLAVDTVVVGKSVTSNISDGLRSLVSATAGLGAMSYVNLKLTVSSCLFFFKKNSVN